MSNNTETKNLQVISGNKQNDTDNIVTLLETRQVSDSAYVLRFNRKNFDFEPGQYLTLGVLDTRQTREYSIYSSVKDEALEVLIKEVEDGFLSLKFKKIKVGDQLLVDGPFGFFNIEAEELKTKKFLFVATGTGISPFHSMIKSYEGKIDYTLLHGVRNIEEAYDREEYDKDRYILCTSRGNKGDYKGRVTDYLKEHDVDNETLVYLCGNSEMIYDVYDILMSKGMSSDNIRTEVYF